MDWLTDATELADSKTGKVPTAKRTSDWPLSDPRVNAAQPPAQSSRLSASTGKKRVSDWIGNWQADSSNPDAPLPATTAKKPTPNGQAAAKKPQQP